MEYEGQHHSWVTGFYWALTVMSTLGFGDITFHSDLGRVFSIIVLLSGILLLLVLLPFSFIQFFYSPWIEAQNKSRAPRALPKGTKKHIIFTSFDDITISLIEKFSRYGTDYIIILDDLKKAMEIFDLGYNVASLLDWETKVIPFVRYTNYNTAASVKNNLVAKDAYNFNKWMVGLSVKPLDEIVVKFDYAQEKNKLTSVKNTYWNIGFGYFFY